MWARSETEAEMFDWPTWCCLMLWFLCFSGFASQHPSPAGLFSVPWTLLASMHQRALANALPPCRNVLSTLPLSSFNWVPPNHPSEFMSNTISVGGHSLTAMIKKNLHYALLKYCELFYSSCGSPNFICI